MGKPEVFPAVGKNDDGSVYTPKATMPAFISDKPNTVILPQFGNFLPALRMYRE